MKELLKSLALQLLIMKSSELLGLKFETNGGSQFEVIEVIKSKIKLVSNQGNEFDLKASEVLPHLNNGWRIIFKPTYDIC